MSIEFEPAAPVHQPEEQLSAPASHRRRWAVVAGVGAAAVVLGGGGVALAQSSSSPSATPTGYASHGPGQPGEGGSAGGGTNGPTVPKARVPHLAGAVKAVSGTKILITDQDGFTRTIITSVKTVYKDSLTASPAVGTKIEAEGAVDADGTSLDATLVQAPPAFGGPGGRPGGPGGPGGPGRDGGPGRPRPTDAPNGAKPTATPLPASTS